MSTPIHVVVACRIVERWDGDEMLGQYFFWCTLTEHHPHNATIATAVASMRSCDIIGGPTLQVDDDNTHSLMRFKSLEKGYCSISLGPSSIFFFEWTSVIADDDDDDGDDDDDDDDYDHADHD